MADTKITNLTQLDGVDIADNDQWVVVDVSDTTQSPSGSTKRIPTSEARVALLAWTEIEVDFGTAPTWSKAFNVTLTGLTSSNIIIAVPSGKPATGRSPGDDEWDGIMYSANPTTDAFTLVAIAFPGPVEGKRKVLYSKVA